MCILPHAGLTPPPPSPQATPLWRHLSYLIYKALRVFDGSYSDGSYTGGWPPWCHLFYLILSHLQSIESVLWRLNWWITNRWSATMMSPISLSVSRYSAATSSIWVCLRSLNLLDAEYLYTDMYTVYIHTYIYSVCRLYIAKWAFIGKTGQLYIFGKLISPSWNGCNFRNFGNILLCHKKGNWSPACGH